MWSAICVEACGAGREKGIRARRGREILHDDGIGVGLGAQRERDGSGPAIRLRGQRVERDVDARGRGSPWALATISSS
jgi:hypothetical protein